MGLKPYKYYFMAENNQEYNYISEKASNNLSKKYNYYYDHLNIYLMKVYSTMNSLY